MKRKKKIWARKFNNFKEAERFDDLDNASMSPMERLETMQYLREIYFKFGKACKYDESRKRLRRTVRIIQQT